MILKVSTATGTVRLYRVFLAKRFHCEKNLRNLRRIFTGETIVCQCARRVLC